MLGSSLIYNARVVKVNLFARCLRQHSFFTCPVYRYLFNKEIILIPGEYTVPFDSVAHIPKHKPVKV